MKYFFNILVLMLLVGCNSIEKPEKPKNLIPKEKMSDIMYDLYILNAAKGVNRKLIESNGIMPSNYVYEKHGIDSLQFAQSNTYYAYDMKVYKGIIEKVKANLENDKALYEQLTNEDGTAKDPEKKIPPAMEDPIRPVEYELVD